MLTEFLRRIGTGAIGVVATTVGLSAAALASNT
jgi:hypothetical protein